MEMDPVVSKPLEMSVSPKCELLMERCGENTDNLRPWAELVDPRKMIWVFTRVLRRQEGLALLL